MAHFTECKDHFSFLANYMKTGHIEDSTLFYSSTPEMVEEDLKKQNLKILHHVGVDGPMFVYREFVEDMNCEDFDAFMDIHFKLCDKRSNLGYSEHGLVIAQKV